MDGWMDLLVVAVVVGGHLLDWLDGWMIGYLLGWLDVARTWWYLDVLVGFNFRVSSVVVSTRVCQGEKRV
jgi:hypothetical protein